LIEKPSPEQQQESNVVFSHSHLVYPELQQLDPVNPDLGLFFLLNFLMSVESAYTCSIKPFCINLY